MDPDEEEIREVGMYKNIGWGFIRQVTNNWRVRLFYLCCVLYFCSIQLWEFKFVYKFVCVLESLNILYFKLCNNNYRLDNLDKE